jgi:hypothetical protein
VRMQQLFVSGGDDDAIVVTVTAVAIAVSS